MSLPFLPETEQTKQNRHSTRLVLQPECGTIRLRRLTDHIHKRLEGARAAKQCIYPCGFQAFMKHFGKRRDYRFFRSLPAETIRLLQLG